MYFATKDYHDEKMNISKVIVTGGAGFIGSHLVDALMDREADVCVLDNLSSGSLENVGGWLEHPRFNFVQGDLLNLLDVTAAVEGSRVCFHLAANPDVRLSFVEPDVYFEQNVVATYNLLEAFRRSGVAESLVFTSSSTVYGDVAEIPTPEDYGPLKPISVYGACKLASEVLISSYARTYGFRAVIFRLANIIGSRSKHGVTYDFVKKLKADPRELEILGDGTQKKSYLEVRDCVDAMLLGLEKSAGQVEVFNLGSEDWIDVKSIAAIVVKEMGLEDVAFRFTDEVDGGRGWKGDVKYMFLAIDRLKSLGWRPNLSSGEAVRDTVRSILDLAPIHARLLGKLNTC